ncbi:MAG: hypothetical protein RLZZ299_2770 [Pseudomonadota bacterium]|jgi:hypothetical protein
MRLHPRVLTLVLVLACPAASPARAGTVSYPLRYGMPSTVFGKACVVAGETVELDCGSLRATNTCAVRHRVTLQGPCTLLAYETYPDAPTLDGVPMVKVNDHWFAAGASPAPHRDARGWIDIPDGTHTLARAWTDPGRPYYPAAVGGIEPDRARHLVLHAGRRGQIWPFEFDAPPAGRRTDDYTLEVILTPPRHIRWQPHAKHWTRAGGRWVARIRPAAGDETNVLRFQFSTADFPVHHGGPMVGAGVAVTEDDVRGLVRMEYEFGLWDYVLPGVSLDTGPAWTLTPRVEVSTMTRDHSHGMYDFYPYDPAWSVGIGMPMLLDGSGRSGVRALVGVEWLALGLTAAMDVPVADGVPAMVSVTARLSL